MPGAPVGVALRLAIMRAGGSPPLVGRLHMKHCAACLIGMVAPGASAYTSLTVAVLLSPMASVMGSTLLIHAASLPILSLPVMRPGAYGAIVIRTVLSRPLACTESALLVSTWYLCHWSDHAPMSSGSFARPMARHAAPKMMRLAATLSADLPASALTMCFLCLCSARWPKCTAAAHPETPGISPGSGLSALGAAARWPWVGTHVPSPSFLPVTAVAMSAMATPVVAVCPGRPNLLHSVRTPTASRPGYWSHRCLRIFTVFAVAAASMPVCALVAPSRNIPFHRLPRAE